MGKRTDVDEFSTQHRGGKGVKCYKITDKTGDIVGAKCLDEDREIMLITNEGVIIRMNISDMRVLGRITSGVKLMDIDKDSDTRIASIAKVREDIEPEGDQEADEAGTEEQASKPVGDDGGEKPDNEE